MIPQLRAWHERYVSSGLTIVGVHSPEFLRERSRDNVASAVERLGVRYPVVQDNDFAIWKRYGVWAWPTAVLVDREGIVRFQHIGEGAYEHTETLIQRLIGEGR